LKRVGSSLSGILLSNDLIGFGGASVSNGHDERLGTYGLPFHALRASGLQFRMARFELANRPSYYK